MKKLIILLIILMSVSLFGCSDTTDNKPSENETENNEEIIDHRHIIENDYLKVEVTELGATLVRLIDKKSGQDIVLGYDSDEDYLRNEFNLGASIGRNANRIGGAFFELNGVTYKLSENDHGNQLHGGNEGFGLKYWNCVMESDDELLFTYLSQDGEEGFPGNLNVQVRYKLDKNTLLWEYTGESDQDTILNMTNHSYFNLGDESIKGEYLHITTDKYAPTDEVGLTLDEIKDVKDTPYDFIEFSLLSDNLSEIDNIDNNYVWETMGEKLMAELKNDKLKLSVYSDLPDMHLFTASLLETDTGKQGKPYVGYGGLALECQYYPNAINYGGKYIMPILKKGEKMSHYIRYELEEVK